MLTVSVSDAPKHVWGGRQQDPVNNYENGK